MSSKHFASFTFALCLTLTLTAGLTACSGGTPQPQGCTAIGCANGLTVEITSASPWKAGTYTLAAEIDGVTATCTATLPLTPNSTAVCTSPDMGLGLSGSMLAADKQSLSDILFPKNPKAIALTLSLDGAQIATKSLTPTYTTSQPNGPDCEPTCTQAHDTLAIP